MCSRVEQRWMLGISRRALALALLSMSLYLKASVSCKYSSGKHHHFWKKLNKINRDSKSARRLKFSS